MGHGQGQKNTRRGKIGYWYIHNAVDDHTRLGYSDLLTDERKETAAGCWQRANAYFNSVGITVKRVLTDNGSCYRSNLFAAALGENIKHERARPYRPQSNGNIERFHRILAEGWAFKKFYSSESARLGALPAWVHEYNHHRPHSAIGKAAPIRRRGARRESCRRAHGEGAEIVVRRVHATPRTVTGLLAALEDVRGDESARERPDVRRGR